ncbi:calumenin-B [Cocos nucifera]|uniref:Calumenin-B n=1 Tax=Cocos nucifera TaxID=13894 RepID=A0A8K0N822_COCNU|nr:calumenin-B [Cocos nucifera]
MVRPAVVYLLLVTAFVFLLSLSGTPHAGQKRRHGRRLAHHHASFDPLVGKLERRAEEQGLLDPDTFQEKLNGIFNDQDWNQAPEIGVFEEYFGEEGRLNVTERLMYLFPLLDRYPEDGKISFRELEFWNRKQALDRLIYSTDGQMKLHDKDRDGAVNLEEFLSHLSKEEIDWDNKDHGNPGWWKEQFLNADKDGSGSLDSDEFRDFLHPEDGGNPATQLWLQKVKLREMDQNEDGKLSFLEFHDRFNDFYMGFGSSETDVADDSKHHQDYAERKFGELDVNKDGFLTAEELKPIINHPQPGEFFYATHFTKYLMREADDDKDGKLTLKEMLNHHQAFYSAAFKEAIFDDYDDDYDIHDELR